MKATEMVRLLEAGIREFGDFEVVLPNDAPVKVFWLLDDKGRNSRRLEVPPKALNA